MQLKNNSENKIKTHILKLKKNHRNEREKNETKQKKKIYTKMMEKNMHLKESQNKIYCNMAVCARTVYEYKCECKCFVSLRAHAMCVMCIIA